MKDFDQIALQLGGVSSENTIDYDQLAAEMKGQVVKNLGIADQQRLDKIEDAEKTGLPSRIRERLATRSDAIGGILERNAPTAAMGLVNAPKIGALSIGQAVGGIGDIAGETMISAYRAGVSPERQEQISNIASKVLNSPVGKAGLKAGGYLAGKGKEFSQAYPDAALAAGGLANIYGLAGGRAVASEAASLSDDLTRLTLKTIPGKLDNEIGNVVKAGMNRGVRPTVVGKGTASASKKYFNKASEAVETITRNKELLPEGKLPQSLDEFSEAIHLNKQHIFKQYDDLLQRVSGYDIDLTDIANNLSNTTGSNKYFKVKRPDIIEYANGLSERLSKEQFSAVELQDFLRSLNKELDNYYSALGPKDHLKAAVDHGLAEEIRETLNNLVEKIPGGDKYKGLKRQYGALREIEEEVGKRAVVANRANVKGIIDFSDVHTIPMAIYAASTQNPTLLTASIAAKGVSRYIKAINDPNRHIRKMFEGVDSLIAIKDDFNASSYIGGMTQQKIQQLKGDWEKYQELKKQGMFNPLVAGVKL